MATTGAVTRAAAKPAAAEGREGVPRRQVRQPDGLAVKAAADPRAFQGEDRYRMIAEAAYYRAERRGFHPGSELDDWLEAEIEVDELLGDSAPRGTA